jgi:amino acid adenylation domain-containing protein
MSERRRVLAWGEGAPTAAPHRCVHELIEAQARRTPHATAVVSGGVRLSYRELESWGNQVAQRLIAAGVEPGALVGVCLERSIELVVAILAIWKAGGAYVPLDVEYPRERLAFMVQDADIDVIVADDAAGERLPDRAWTVVRAAADHGGRVDAPGPRASARDLAYVIYTSGSTGMPKGVMIEHRSVANHARWMVDRFGITARDAVLQKSSASFDASVCEFAAPLVCGARVVLAPSGPEADRDQIVTLCREHAVTLIQFVPSLLALFAEADGLEDLCALRHLIAGGEALPPALAARVAKRLPGCAVHNLYGPTEATIDATFHTCTAEDVGPTVPIGRPIGGARVRVLDEALQPVVPGVPGELCVGGAGLARGYLRRPELTAERFIADPFDPDPGARLYRTGDLVGWRANGELEFLGRLDEQVKLRGFRIELGEIEAALLEDDAVAEAVTVLHEGEGEPRLVAYVVARAGTSVTPAALRSRLAARLPDYMVPSAFVRLAALPVTANGKLDRPALPAPTASDTARAAGYMRARDGLERDLVDLWEQLLGVTPIGVLDDFFALGGSSLIATRLRSTYATKLTVRSLFDHPTVAGQAACLRAQHMQKTVSMREGERSPPGITHGLR